MTALHAALAESPSAPSADMAARLHRAGFADPHRAWPMLHTLDRRMSALSTDHDLAPLFEAMVVSFDPERAFGNLYTLLLETDETMAASLARLITRHPDRQTALLTILAASQPLASLLIQDPGFAVDLLDNPGWRTLHSRDDMAATLDRLVPPTTPFDKAFTGLRQYKKREYLHIALCDLTKSAETPDVLRALSDVADLCLQRAFEVCAHHLEERHGPPLLEDGSPSGFAVMGMGKLGGRELNFDSDIDLIYVYDSTDGHTAQSGLSTYEYYPKLARSITELVGSITNNGFVFRVDLRLRPEGRAGDIANSVEGYRWHYDTNGQPWQRQALIKARPVAGSQIVGNQFLDAVRSQVFRPSHDPLVLDDINRMREKIAHALIARGSGPSHVKLGSGGIRDIEFIVQGFQLVYGGPQNWPWERSTLPALSYITHRRYLTDEEAAALHHAYLFLRDLENRIQMLAGRQTHEIPTDLHSRAVLARMCGFHDPLPENAVEALMTRYHLHTERVRSIYDRVFHSAM
ncbi:MAG: hypothetical protein FJY97_04020, partial [candidate division Zixibacteria bacterium]|nr:hypothetical protein [candidate division Zixibacteria bacterium]